MFYHVSSILGKRFGITNDYMGHSFLKVSNTLTKKFDNRIDSPQKILFLLPRCLEKTVQKEITELSRINNCRCFVLSGGNAARNKIKELVPQAIIAIACERDLVSGLIDISGKIPVVAIPNVRPEGPCKNTKVNMNDVEEALNYFLSKGQN
ncbi:MAG: DUF116 domain-containing protein [Candidatus Theseobacter exili]|nr:DUF116 domain-containing protein [Candidatus Theseobacter exili]